MNTTLNISLTKCTHCQEQLDSPLVCHSCHMLLPPAGQLDYFELFGLEKKFDLDESLLKKKYLALSRSIHPDSFSQSSPEMKGLSVQLSAELNHAYDTLRNPISRAEYLLQQQGGPSGADDKRLPQNYLTEVMSWQEELEDAKLQNSDSARQSVLAMVHQRRQKLLSRIAQLSRQLNSPESFAGVELREQLNCVKYLDNLLAQGV